MFWTPVRSETSTIMDVAKLTRFSWWQLTAGPVSQRNSSGPRICSGGTNMLAGLFRFL